MNGGDVDRIKQLIERMRNSSTYTTNTEEYVKELSELLEYHRKKGNKQLFKEMAEYISSDFLLLNKFVHHVWSNKHHITKGLGYLMKHILNKVKEDVKQQKYDVSEKNKIRKLIITLSLLSTGAHHDIPSIKRIHPFLPEILNDILPKDVDILRLFGRRPSSKLLKHTDLVNTYLDIIHDRLVDNPFEHSHVIPTLSHEDLKMEDTDTSWVDRWINKIKESVILINNLEKSLRNDFHPSDYKHALVFLVANHDSIDERIKNAAGEDFFRYKFGEDHKFVLDLKKRFDDMSRKKRKYEIHIPDDYIGHVIYQTVPAACTSWRETFSGILHGPFIPIGIRDKKTKKIIGRVFIGVVKDIFGNKQVFYGDYEGKMDGLKQFKRYVKPVVKDLSIKHFNTEPVYYHFLRTSRSVEPPRHSNPWI